MREYYFGDMLDNWKCPYYVRTRRPLDELIGILAADAFLVPREARVNVVIFLHTGQVMHADPAVASIICPRFIVLCDSGAENVPPLDVAHRSQI